MQYGDFSASRERALTAAKQVGLTAWAERTPGGFDARVGERGQALSGGERQRVAVARALLKRPALLLCDEATSALDPLIERSVVEVLNAASANVTTVLVAHKLQTVVDADLILVMCDGSLVEQGTHASLLCRANSTYATMWAEQASGFYFYSGAAGANGAELDYCKLALDDQPYVPWSAAQPARSKLLLLAARPRGRPPLQRPAPLLRATHTLWARGRGEPLPFGAEGRLWRRPGASPIVADSAALDQPGRPGGCRLGEGLQQQASRPRFTVRIGGLALVSTRWPGVTR